MVRNRDLVGEETLSPSKKAQIKEKAKKQQKENWEGTIRKRRTRSEKKKKS